MNLFKIRNKLIRMKMVVKTINSNKELEAEISFRIKIVIINRAKIFSLVDPDERIHQFDEIDNVIIYNYVGFHLITLCWI